MGAMFITVKKKYRKDNVSAGSAGTSLHPKVRSYSHRAVIRIPKDSCSMQLVWFTSVN